MISRSVQALIGVGLLLAVVSLLTWSSPLCDVWESPLEYPARLRLSAYCAWGLVAGLVMLVVGIAVNEKQSD